MVCKACKSQVSSVGQFCPQCGTKFKPQLDYRIWIAWGVAIGIGWTIMIGSMLR